MTTDTPADLPADVIEAAAEAMEDATVTPDSSWRQTVTFVDGDKSAVVYPAYVAEAIVRPAEAVERLAPDDPDDPPVRDWLVPAAQMDALREARQHWSPLPGEPLLDAVSAVLDAAREVEHE